MKKSTQIFRIKRYIENNYNGFDIRTIDFETHVDSTLTFDENLEFIIHTFILNRYFNN